MTDEQAQAILSRHEKLGEGVKFERIRRITGYLTGTVERWCNAKQSELRDRVKHKGTNDEQTPSYN